MAPLKSPETTLSKMKTAILQRKAIKRSCVGVALVPISPSATVLTSEKVGPAHKSLTGM